MKVLDKKHALLACTNISTKHRNQTSFAIGDKESCQGTRTQFPLALAWAVTIHKCQGLTLPEIVVDMTPAEGRFRSGRHMLLPVVSVMFQNCILLTIPTVKYMCVNMLLKKWKY